MCLAKRGAQEEALRNAHLCLADANAVLNIDEGAFGDAGVEIPLRRWRLIIDYDYYWCKYLIGIDM